MSIWTVLKNLGVIMIYYKFAQYSESASLKRFQLLLSWIKARRLATFLSIKRGSGESHVLFNNSSLHTSVSSIRETYAPDIDSDQFPPAQHVRSIHNTPIEGLWHWFVTLFGIDIKDAIQEGKVTGIYNPGNPIHPYVMLFFPLP